MSVVFVEGIPMLTTWQKDVVYVYDTRVWNGYWLLTGASETIAVASVQRHSAEKIK